MIELKTLFKKIKDNIQCINTIKDLNKIKIKYLGKKGILTEYFKNIKNLSLQEKKKFSLFLNDIKNKIIIELNIKQKKINDDVLFQRIKKEKLDISLSGRRLENGVIHPITKTIEDVKKFFLKLGFYSINGFEIEDEYHNFDALNISKNHPSRNNRDTFWFDKTRLLRTQTSSMQIRIMKKEKPPMRFIFPGKVYRNDYDNTHTPMFHQVEGLIVEKNINFSHLKWIIYNFLHDFFGKNIFISFRPSYFPFTVPSAEVDLILKNGQSLEILGCGMVHPKVLKNVNINSSIYSACAFGIGIERLAMLRYKIHDIRSFFENDVSFLKQFKYNE